MTALPYQVNIKFGAHAYSPDGLRDWGIIPDAFRVNATVYAIVGDKLRINNPLWNSREWCVKLVDTTEATAPPPPEPNPTIHLTHTIQVYNDGSIVVDGIPVIV